MPKIIYFITNFQGLCCRMVASHGEVGALNVWLLYHYKSDIRSGLVTVDSCVLDRVEQGGCCLQNNSFSARRCGREQRRDGDCMRLKRCARLR